MLYFSKIQDDSHPGLPIHVVESYLDFLLSKVALLRSLE